MLRFAFIKPSWPSWISGRRSRLLLWLFLPLLTWCEPFPFLTYRSSAFLNRSSYSIGYSDLLHAFWWCQIVMISLRNDRRLGLLTETARQRHTARKFRGRGARHSSNRSDGHADRSRSRSRSRSPSAQRATAAAAESVNRLYLSRLGNVLLVIAAPMLLDLLQVDHV